MMTAAREIHDLSRNEDGFVTNCTGDLFQAGLRLLPLVQFQQMPGLFEVQNVVVNRELIFTGVLGDVMDVANVVAFGSEGVYEKVDVYHGCLF